MPEITQIGIPKPVREVSPNFRFCPRCGQEAMEPATHTLEPMPPTYFAPVVHGFECQECGIFFTGTYLGISYVERG